jgi:NAD(P)-dependent dehydrogenase (short-subunit alcohol dehydrogenase family)
VADTAAGLGAVGSRQVDVTDVPVLQAAVLPHMEAHGWSGLVTIASVSGKVGGTGPVDAQGSAIGPVRPPPRPRPAPST